MDSDSFPALPDKSIDVQVPIGILEDMGEEDSEQVPGNIQRNQIIAKFNELKTANKIHCPKSLINENIHLIPILLKEGDIRLEELEPTQRKDVFFLN